MPSSPPPSIAILGAGITGLATAHRLSKLGCRIRIFEKRDQVGGVIDSKNKDGWLCEQGPHSLLAGNASIGALIEELGLSSECVTANLAAKNRYLLRNGHLIAVPHSLLGFLTTPLFRAGAKLRLLMEMTRRPHQRTADISLRQLIVEHFGDEIADYALNPFVAGVYAGDPAKLSAQYAFPSLWEMERQHGSILRGQLALGKERSRVTSSIKGIVSFRRGLQTLTDALASTLPEGALQLSAEVRHIYADDRWQVLWRTTQGQLKTEYFDRVVCALPAKALARLQIGSSGQYPLECLAQMAYPPVDSLVLGYRKDQVLHPLDGFGLLVPEMEARPFLGVIFTSTLFTDRAPRGHHALTVLIGGTRQPALTGLATETLLRRILPDLNELLGISGEPVFQHHRHLPHAIPQYELGHEHFLLAMADCEQQHPGLFIGGQARDGIALPDCLASGEMLATRAARL